MHFIRLFYFLNQILFHNDTTALSQSFLIKNALEGKIAQLKLKVIRLKTEI